MKQAVLSFVPVIHSGYIDFFSKNKGDIYIFGRDIIDSYIHLTRDLRVVDPADAVKSLGAILPSRNLQVIGLDQLKSLKLKYTEIVMPDDEICHDVALKHLKGLSVIFDSIFLRWNKVITFRENEIPAQRRISNDQFHKEIIEKAFNEAKKSSDWWRQIATLVVKDGKIIFSAHNHHLPTDFHLSVNGDPRSNFDAGEHQDIFTSIHSEAAAIAEAANKGVSLKDSMFYVTTFPCPNCARLMGKAGVKKLYYSKGYSLLDAEKILNHFGIEIILVQ